MDVETCRICANFYVTTSEVEFVHLFQPVQESLQSELNFIINEINTWQLNIAPDDGLPQRICANCFTKFCTIDAFRQECESAQNMLRKALEAQHIKSGDVNVDISQQTFVVPATDFNQTIATNNEPTIQSIASNDVGVTQLQTETLLVPQDIAINYNITYDENAPSNFVIKDEGFVTVPRGETLITNMKSNTSTKLSESNVNYKSQSFEQNSHVAESQDLEEMLKSSVIKKSNIDETSNKRGVKRKANSLNNSIDEDDNMEDDDEILDEKPAQRIANFSFACNYCYCPPVGPIGHLIFKCSEALSQHFFDVHDPKSPYPCPKCPKLFITNRRRNSHVTRVHNVASQRIIRCPYCRKAIRTPLEIHENSCTYLSDWKCNVCERDFRQMPLHSFRAHQRTHYSNPKFRCEICKRDFMRRTNFEAHKKMHEPKLSSNQSESCIECKQTFSNTLELKQHEWTEHAGRALFRCKYCDKGYSSSVFLQRHIENLHSDLTTQGLDEITCSICSVTFPSKLKLYFHQQRPKDENGQCIALSSPKVRLACPHCSKRFTTKQQMDHHLETHDARLRPYACERCSVRCRTASDLKQHTNMAHFNKNAFTCDECNESFGYRKDLENHKLYHSKLTFKCSVQRCQCAFVTEEELSEHIRSIHEPVSCEYCGEIFTRNELKVHKNSESCLTSAVFGKVNGTTNINENTFNGNNDVNKSQIEASSSAPDPKSNVCVQYVNEQQHSIVLNDELTTPTHTQQNVLDFLQLAADGNIISAPNVPLNDDDYFISSLLDPDNEIVVT